MRHLTDQKDNLPKGNRQTKLLWVVLAIVFVGIAAVWALVQVRQKSTEALLLDSVSNTAKLLADSTEPYKVSLEFEPNGSSDVVAFRVVADGSTTGGVYSGTGSVRLTVGDQNVSIPAQYYTDTDGQWVRFTDFAKIIAQIEAKNPTFKLFSGYVSELALKYEGKWIKLSDSESTGGLANCSGLLAAAKEEGRVADTYGQNPFVSDIKKLGSENVGSVPSEHLQVQIDSEQLAQFANATTGTDDQRLTKECVETITRSGDTIDIWIDTQNRVFTKITTQIDSGKLSTTLVPSTQQSATPRPTKPTEFTTVEQLKIDAEYIIGSF